MSNTALVDRTIEIFLRRTRIILYFLLKVNSCVASQVMTTQGYHKRACAVAMLKHVKNPIKLAQEMLVRGQHDGDDQSDLEGSLGDSEGAQGHVYLGGNTAERLATQWGLEMVEQEYFWTKKRWQQHRRGLKKRHDQNGGDDVLVRDEIRTDNTGLNDGGDWDGIEYLPQGTTGCVALDQYGTICVATSTGGMTNKLPFRIGDTPTIGAGFWAEQWNEAPLEGQLPPKPLRNMRKLSNRLGAIFGGCLSRSGSERLLSSGSFEETERTKPRDDNLHAIAVSGTGNGDSFLKLSAARTVGAIVRFSYPALPPRTLASAFNQIVGQGGEMQRSAGHNWGKTGEGEGGMIGIELKDRESTICWEFNCGGMFRCWGDCHGSIHVGAFEEDEMMGRELQSSGH